MLFFIYGDKESILIFYKKANAVWKTISFSIIGVFALTILCADLLRIDTSIASTLNLPKPAQLFTNTRDYSTPTLKGLSIDPQNPLKIDFIVDTEDDDDVNEEQSRRLIQYFMAGLTVPEGDLWVNLSPYEKDRIMTDELSHTDLGRDMLRQDYMLKQLSSSLTHPQTPLGQTYWEKFSINDSRLSTESGAFSKVWIVPDAASVYEKDTQVLITDASLKVQTELDYLAASKNSVIATKDSSNAMETLIPELNDIVNYGKYFSEVRQMYNAVILAKWFKQKFENSFYKYYFDQQKTTGIELTDKEIKQKVFTLYKEAFEKGTYDLILKSKKSQNIKRRYFSGGLSYAIDQLSSGSSIVNAQDNINGNLKVVSSTLTMQQQDVTGDQGLLDDVKVLGGYVLNGFEKKLFDAEFDISDEEDSVALKERFLDIAKSKNFFDAEDNKRVVMDSSGNLKYFTSIKGKNLDLEFDTNILSSVHAQGGMANVYKISSDGKEYILRVLNPNVSTKILINNFRATVIQKILAKNNSAPKILGVGLSEKIVDGQKAMFMISEYGGEASDKITFDSHGLEKFLSPVLNGLKLMHDENIPHSDIKPLNILVDKDLIGTLIDYELAMKGGHITTNKNGKVLGSLHYMAPEVVGMQGQEMIKRYTTQTDIYALGCSIFEYLTGQKLHNNVKKLKDMAANWSNPEFIDNRLAQVQIAQNYKELIRRMTLADPGQRPSIDAVIAYLNHIWNPKPELPQGSLKELKGERKQLANILKKQLKDYVKMEQEFNKLDGEVNKHFDSDTMVFSKKQMKNEQRHSELMDLMAERRKDIKTFSKDIALFDIAIEEAKQTTSALRDGGIDLNDIDIKSSGSSIIADIKIDADSFAGFKLDQIQIKDIDELSSLGF